MGLGLLRCDLGDLGGGSWFFIIVPGSGRDLQGISGTGGIAVDPDGTHRIWLDYEISVD